MFSEYLLRYTNGKRPKGRPIAFWRDYTSMVDRECLGDLIRAGEESSGAEDLGIVGWVGQTLNSQFLPFTFMTKKVMFLKLYTIRIT